MRLQCPGTARHAGKARRAMPAAENAKLHVKTQSENARHIATCDDKQCAWCRAICFLEKHKGAFQVVEDSLIDSPQFRGLSEKHRALASTPWLGMGHRDGDIMLGCVPCRAMHDLHMTSAFAAYRIPALRLFSATGRPHVLLRHAETVKHIKAVNMFVGKDAGDTEVNKERTWCLGGADCMGQ